MISFIPRVGKVQTGQSSGGFTAIIPLSFYQIELKLFMNDFGLFTILDLDMVQSCNYHLIMRCKNSDAKKKFQPFIFLLS